VDRIRQRRVPITNGRRRVRKKAETRTKEERKRKRKNGSREE
jgi:hypothetical protein